jgi:polysaccharide deacetylase 2 family uncharacterized protein YibQ
LALRSDLAATARQHVRDAHEALAVLKKLVDSAEGKIRLAEREAIAVAIGHRKDDNPLKTLRDAADTLQSPDFETAFHSWAA